MFYAATSAPMLGDGTAHRQGLLSPIVRGYGGGVTDRPDIFTAGELRASGHVLKDLRQEIRGNLLAALAAGKDPWPGIYGFGRRHAIHQR